MIQVLFRCASMVFVLAGYALMMSIAPAGAQGMTEVRVPERCVGRQPAAILQAETCKAQDVDCFELEKVLHKKFPGSTNSVEFRQDRNTYVALRFSTQGLTAKSGRWAFETAQGFSVGGQGAKLMTLSTCPGDFDKYAIEQEMGGDCYVKVSGFNNLTWRRADIAESGFGKKCELQADQVYYLNILYTSDPVGTPPSKLKWDCSGDPHAWSCGNLMKASFTP